MDQAEYQKQWREKNKEKYKTYQKKWREENKEYLQKYQKEYRKDNNVILNAKVKQYLKTHPDIAEKIRQNKNRKAREKRLLAKGEQK